MTLPAGNSTASRRKWTTRNIGRPRPSAKSENGFLGVSIPQDYGGAGMDLVSAGLVAQAFARWNHAMALSVVAHDNLCANNIYRNGNEAQRRKYLPGLCSGELVGALGLTEPGAGSDALGSMSTTARREGDHYVLNGRKIYITNGPVADVLLVYAKTDKERGAHGVSAFIVEKDFPGFQVAQKLEKMGYRGSPTGELVFDECRVPAENLVGAENAGVAVVMSGLDLERAIVAALCLGISERALDLCVEYAQTAGNSASRSARSRWCNPCWLTSMSRSKPSAPLSIACWRNRHRWKSAAAAGGISTP